MGKIERFEDLKVWQAARELSQSLHLIAQKDRLSKDYSLKDQINRSSGSIMDNIAEGFERGGKKEFIQFLYIAKGSAGELRSQLHRAFDRQYITQLEYEQLFNKTVDVGQQLSGFIKYLKTSEYKGSKYVHEPQLQYEGKSNLEF
ncbi:MAG: four helix bundle protein [Cyclobacteriaceae bacterium]|nr:four helix bundle protein [Cyclobacteriaceae bacterium]